MTTLSDQAQVFAPVIRLDVEVLRSAPWSELHGRSCARCGTGLSPETAVDLARHDYKIDDWVNHVSSCRPRLCRRCVPLQLRDTASAIAADDAEPPVPHHLAALVSRLSVALGALIPVVEAAAERHPAGSLRRAGAEAGLSEARVRLAHPPRLGDRGRRFAHAQRLARSVVCLLDHVARLTTAPKVGAS
ncbi:DUF6415 family natural product biosynthesis protein [Streptomyces sp. TRM76323]|uniref:DUF6415 family natural product biosynthesis protein n=1 Tax=Streptomyces tamarix TaxID=3078565 RepID=A0ABU3QGZ5_9ACTN|nr:DUF6415 family natural product biosynthesis protein [Streptomyces tamarix]MDT9682043.1 DUF6415 family natural product biosynthesis protein [Streptomyces tamarix]